MRWCQNEGFIGKSPEMGVKRPVKRLVRKSPVFSPISDVARFMGAMKTPRARGGTSESFRAHGSGSHARTAKV